MSLNSNPEPLPSRQEAFVRLFTQHEPMLRGFILTLVPTWEDAAEVLQETSVVAWRKFDEFELGSSFHSWIFRIAVLEVYHYRDRNQKLRFRFDQALLEKIIDTRRQDWDSTDERRRVLAQCLDKLRPSDRQLVLERYSDQRKGKQIAESQGRPADSIYKALKRIRAALFECIERTLAREERE